MPKRFNRRKRKSMRTGVATVSEEKPQLVGEGINIETNANARLSNIPKAGLIDHLANVIYTNKPTPFLISLCLPFPIAALVAAGGVLVNLDLFLITSAVFLIIIYLSQGWGRASGLPFASLGIESPSPLKSNILVLIFVGLFLMLYEYQVSYPMLAMIGLVGAGLLWLLSLTFQATWQLIWGCLLLLCVSGGLSIIGVYTQYPSSIMWVSAAMGLVPASAGSCALLVRFSSVLEKSGWRRRREVVTQSGEKVMRPGLASLIFSLFVLLIPGNIFWFAVLGYVPTAFVLTAFLLIYLSKCLTKFYEGEQEDPQLWPQIQLVYLVSSIAMLFIGAMSRG